MKITMNIDDYEVPNDRYKVTATLYLTEKQFKELNKCVEPHSEEVKIEFLRPKKLKKVIKKKTKKKKIKK